jgi:hypothetical protein
MWALMAGLVIACLIIAVLWPRGTRQGAAAPPYRFTISTPTMFDLGDFAVSPDGRSVAFVALADSKMPAVWIRAFADADSKVLPGTEGSRWVFCRPIVNRSVSRRIIRSIDSPFRAAPPGPSLASAGSSLARRRGPIWFPINFLIVEVRRRRR